MAYYNPVYSAGYQNGYYGGGNPYQQLQQMQAVQPTPPPNQAQSNNSGLIWVQGEAGAKSFLVAPNNTVLLMDSEIGRFYLKSSDASGVPLPLRVFEYHEIPNNQNKPENPQPVTQNPDYVTKTEFDAFKDEINKMLTVSKPTAEKVTQTKGDDE